MAYTAPGGAPEPPLPTEAPGWLTDAAHVFKADEEQRLELLRILRSLEDSTGAEAAVVTLPRLPPGHLSSRAFAVDLFNRALTWPGPGSERIGFSSTVRPAWALSSRANHFRPWGFRHQNTKL